MSFSPSNSQEIVLVKNSISEAKRREEKKFHASTVQRRVRNRISRISDEAGNWISNEDDIKNLIQYHFSNLYAANDSSD